MGSPRHFKFKIDVPNRSLEESKIELFTPSSAVEQGEDECSTPIAELLTQSGDAIHSSEENKAPATDSSKDTSEKPAQEHRYRLEPEDYDDKEGKDDADSFPQLIKMGGFYVDFGKKIGKGNQGSVLTAYTPDTARPDTPNFDVPVVTKRFDLTGGVQGYGLGEQQVLNKLGLGLSPGPIKNGVASFIFMKRFNGKNLSEEKQITTLSTDQKLYVLAELGKKLTHIHKSDIVHGDIKPDNIMIEINKNPTKIELNYTDYGVSRFTNKYSYVPLLGGTATYLPVEGKPPYELTGFGSDIHALALTIKEVFPLNWESDKRIKSIYDSFLFRMQGKDAKGEPLGLDAVTGILDKNYLALMKAFRPNSTDVFEFFTLLKAYHLEKDQELQDAQFIKLQSFINPLLDMTILTESQLKIESELESAKKEEQRVREESVSAFCRFYSRRKCVSTPSPVDSTAFSPPIKPRMALIEEEPTDSHSTKKGGRRLSIH